MKNIVRGLLTAVVVLSAAAAALGVAPVEITSGQLFIGGTSYDTPEHQTYFRFFMNGESRNPKRTYQLAAEQFNAVYMDHPVQPVGSYEYKVRMPYHSSTFAIDEFVYFPVWYSGCQWTIQSSLVTPDVTPGSAQFVTVTAPFRMTGGSNFYGAYSTGFRMKGAGRAEIKFEKIGTKYFMLEARYIFEDATPPNAVPDTLLPPVPAELPAF